MLHDVRYALRKLARAPGLAVSVIMIIGFALGLNTAMFTIFDAYVLRPFAVHDPYSLYQPVWIMKDGGRLLTQSEFDYLRHENTLFSDAIETQNVITIVAGVPLLGQRVSTNYFRMLGVAPAMGRPLMDGDLNVVVLSDMGWKAKFAGDPAILGQKITMLGEAYTVVGVARPEFSGISQASPEFWIPIDPARAQSGLSVTLRLKPGVSPKQAEAALSVWAVHAAEDRPADKRPLGIQLILNATRFPLSGATLALFSPIFAAFSLVLVIACANVANLMLARALARRIEIEVRLSLGATRGRLIRQLLTENLLLSIPAALVGCLAARLSIRCAEEIFYSTAPPYIANLFHFAPLENDFRVVAFTLMVALGSTLLFGFAPAIQGTRTTVRQSFRPSRLRNALVITQVSVCVLLLICAAILLRAGQSMKRQDVGLAMKGVVDVELQSGSAEKAVTRLRQQPWVVSTAVTTRAPLAGAFPAVAIASDGVPQRSPILFVSPEYFSIFKIPIGRGRPFTASESSAEAPVTIISAATARRYFPGRDALGQTIRIEPDQRIDRGKLPKFHTAQVIGIAGDVTSGVVWDGPDASLFYFPAGFRAPDVRTLLVQLKDDTEAERRSLNEILSRDGIATTRTIPMQEMLESEIFPFRISSAIAGFLGVLALVLTISGIYGVMSFLVTQRVKEIGIRIALGASTRSVVGLVLAQSSRLTAIGLLIGVAAATGVSRIFASILEMINTYEPLAYAGAILFVSAAALGASYIPSRRAAAIDPASTLRCD